MRATSASGSAERAVRDVLMRINQAWLHSEIDDLIPYFHEHALILPPGGPAHLRGRDACIQRYREFVQTARVIDYVEHDVTVDVFDDTAVATYRFDITYEVRGRSMTDSGIDVFIFARRDSEWRAVFRTVQPLLPASGEMKRHGA